MTIGLPTGDWFAATTPPPTAGGTFPSDAETTSHVVRRLGVGANARVALESASTDEAIATCLDLTPPPAPLPDFPEPTDLEDATRGTGLAIPLGHWFEQMVRSPRLIEERLVWFWHDHFATGFRKVRIPYFMHLQHATIREHATGRFDLLLEAVATDPAMLIYLDGRTNQAGAINENFAREVMELHTMGRGNYTQDDVVAAARAFTGWVVTAGDEENRRRTDIPLEPWSAVLIPFRRDRGPKTLLGVSGDLDLSDALQIILDQPATARFVAAKMYRELIGLEPPEKSLDRIAAAFRDGWEVMRLVEEVVADPAFISPEAVRAKVRTPVERLVGIAQGLSTHAQAGRVVFDTLRRLNYMPFGPPNPAGFATGSRLLGPYHMAHTLDLAGAIADPAPDHPTAELFTRLGLYDVTPGTWEVVDAAPSPLARIALACASPEYALT